MSQPAPLKSRTFARDRRVWIATLVACAFVWAGTSAWLNRHVPLGRRDPAGPNDDGRFVVLAYDRIVPMPDGKSVDRLAVRAQLRALASAGWQPVTLRDVGRAYAGTATLPRRPMLLTFDEGYLTTYEAVDPVLRELKWPAVMFLRTERQEDRDVSFLFWDRLRRMALSGLWEIASGDPPEPRDPGAAAAGDGEPPGAALISRRLDFPAAPAWAPRGTEPLIALGKGTHAVHWLGFVDDPVGANDPMSSPLRIARLRVDPRWSTHELLHRVEVAVSVPKETGEGVWILGDGSEADAGSVVHLSGRPRADLWVPSTRWVDDWSLEATIRVAGGEFWIVQPGAVPGREWRFGGTAGGLYVQDRSAGRPPESLASRRDVGAIDGTHAVRIVKRGGGVCVSWDDRPLFPAPVALPEQWRGRVGLVSFDGRGSGSLIVEHLSVTPLPYRVRAVPASPDARDVPALTAAADDIAALSPPWARVEGAAVHEEAFDRDLFRMLGRRYAWDILPTVAVTGDLAAGAEAPAWFRDLPARVAAEGWAGLRIDLRAVPRRSAAAWEAAAQELALDLRRAHRRLVIAS